ncbi:hypothetical protein [Nostoc sp.]
MGSGEWEMREMGEMREMRRITNAQCPMPNAQSLVPITSIPG